MCSEYHTQSCPVLETVRSFPQFEGADHVAMNDVLGSTCALLHDLILYVVYLISRICTVSGGRRLTEAFSAEKRPLSSQTTDKGA